MVGYSYGYGFEDWAGDGPNRAGWSDKSDAALRREREAKGLFDAFLENCAALDVDDAFPVTEEVVHASTHLTGPCYTSFRKHVMAKGCKVKRREATHAEKKASGDSRKGKLYVISITCPVHPTRAADAKTKSMEAVAARKKKAREAAERKTDKERKDRQERERLAALHRAKVRDTYKRIAGSCEEDCKRKQNQTTPVKSLGTMDAFVTMDIASAAVLGHAQTVHEERTDDIRSSVRTEESDLMAELRRKHVREENELRNKMADRKSMLMDEANAEYAVIKTKIDESCKEKTRK